MTAVHPAVLVPVKRFGAAKGRLSGVLSADERAQLAMWMAARVLAAAGAYPTYVACDDEWVREWALDQGARIVWGPGLGLNGAVDDGISRIATDGFDHVLVSHADLPRPWALAEVLEAGSTVLVPDQDHDGTNVMAFPLEHRLEASYGAGSFERHLAQTRAVGPVGRVDVRDHADLSLDVDTPDDLAHPRVREVLPEWVRTRLASRPSV